MPIHTDIWDDTLLIQKYDESIMLAKEVVAKRIAQSTNTTAAHEANAATVAVVEPTSSTSAADPTTTADADVQLEPFRAGDWVRSTFTEDGLDYEAQILSIDAHDQCHIRYVGYDNEEYVHVGTLIDSWGEAARAEQRQLALEAASSEHTDAAQQTSAATASGCGTAAGTGNVANANKKPAAKTSKKNKSKSFERYRAAMMIPPPPPLPPMLAAAGGGNDDDPESEYLSSMLMAWYMSGYYTGLYQGQKLTAVKRTTQMGDGANADDDDDDNDDQE